MHKEMEEKAAYVEKLNATAQLITQEYPLTEVQFTNCYSPPPFGIETGHKFSDTCSILVDLLNMMVDELKCIFYFYNPTSFKNLKEEKSIILEKTESVCGEWQSFVKEVKGYEKQLKKMEVPQPFQLFISHKSELFNIPNPALKYVPS